jgi:hypothetical protein
VPLPANLLNAVTAPGGGRLVLVLGAGCSIEPPTSLHSARHYAQEAHDSLIAEGVLKQGQCGNPDDLSSVADAVWSATGSQAELVRRMPVAAFRSADANDGYILAAALLLEYAVGSVMTLNFDLAMSAALARVDARGDVATIAGPQDHANLGLINLIYLHRNANAVADDWILRTSPLQELWQGAWEQAIAQRVLAAAVTVFAGLGTPAAVLIDTAQRVRSMVGNTADIYQVDVVPSDQSAFLAALGLAPTSYIQLPWTEFMRELSQRVADEHRKELLAACTELQASEGWETENVNDLCAQARDLGLISLGQLRARWLLSDRRYMPRRLTNGAHIADLILAIRLIERTTGTQARLEDDGVVEFWEGDRMRASLLFVSGRGVRRWRSLEIELHKSERYWRYRRRIRHAIVAGVHGASPQNTAPPDDLVRESTSDDIVSGEPGVRLTDVDAIRSGAVAALELFA